MAAVQIGGDKLMEGLRSIWPFTECAHAIYSSANPDAKGRYSG